MVDGKTLFFEDPKEVWDWLELYKKGQDNRSVLNAEPSAPKKPRCQRNMQIQKVSRPTRTQSNKDKMAAIETTGNITAQKTHTEQEPGSSDQKERRCRAWPPGWRMGRTAQDTLDAHNCNWQGPGTSIHLAPSWGTESGVKPLLTVKSPPGEAKGGGGTEWGRGPAPLWLEMEATRPKVV